MSHIPPSLAITAMDLVSIDLPPDLIWIASGVSLFWLPPCLPGLWLLLQAF